MPEWKPKAAALVDVLTERGELHSTQWQQAFAEVPRHVFAPGYWELGADDYVDATNPRWLDGVYANEALITQTRPPLGEGNEHVAVPTSSSSMPGVMAHMLEALDVQDGQQVLEIGTGTGYNTALLSHRLGDARVASVDLDPELVKLAAERLAQAGYSPTLHAGDGTVGLPNLAPFDRIVCTAAIDHVPPAWIEQLVLDGIIVAPLQGSISGGLIKLVKTSEDTVEGRFDAYPVSFMPLRPTIDNPQRHEPTEVIIDQSNPYRTTTTIYPRMISDDRAFRFFLQMASGSIFTSSLTAGDSGKLFVIESDGSWFAVDGTGDSGEFPVSQSGPRRLWDTVQTAYELWHRLGQPHREQFGITATDNVDSQRIRLAVQHDNHSWPLPL